MPTYTERGIAAAEANDLSLAYVFLTLAVEAEPQNETALLWLSACVETDDERQQYLERLLVLNPQHPAALRGLALLTKKRDSVSSLARLRELN